MKTYAKFIVNEVIILSLATISLTACSGGSSYYSFTCDWCGKKEDCKPYTGQYVAGYNNDGSFKFEYETLHLSDDCYSKAKDSGKWTIIGEMK
jgi:hypothetical protein